jgi:ribose transport system permease protein
VLDATEESHARAPVASPHGLQGRGRRYPPLLSLLPYLYLVGLLGAVLVADPGIVVGQGSVGIRADGALTLVLVAIGQTFAIMTGGIDLSVGGVISVVTTLLATHMVATGGLYLLELAAILVGGGLAGAFNGIIIARTGLQPFIVTLCTWSIWDGIAIFILPVEGGVTSADLTSWTAFSVGGVPESIIVVAAIIAAWWWLRTTRLVLDFKAIGSDARRAELTGVDVRRRKVEAYIISGCLAAAAGIWLSGQIASGDPTIGSDYILESVAAAVIGGASIFGGTGSIAGTTAGAFAFLAIPDLVYALQLQSYVSVLIQGVLLLVAVGVTSVITQVSRVGAQ